MPQVKQSPDINIDVCVDNVGGSQFQLVLIAATRAREIANSRRIIMKGEPAHKFENKTVAAALSDVENGKVGREYLQKVRAIK
jgi:DNA-directed RNA polymerase omega subunit